LQPSCLGRRNWNIRRLVAIIGPRGYIADIRRAQAGPPML
jgi:hypothetical protein